MRLSGAASCGIFSPHMSSRRFFFVYVFTGPRAGMA